MLLWTIHYGEYQMWLMLIRATKNDDSWDILLKSRKVSGEHVNMYTYNIHVHKLFETTGHCMEVKSGKN